MKLLKKASLAASIAAVSFAANAELAVLDDAAMSEATGQAGIDLDITLEGTDAISIGEVLYTDTDTGGSLSISNVAIGTTSTPITLSNVIDITADGVLTIDQVNDVNDLLITVGSVDLKGTGGENANLLSNVSLNMEVGASETAIGTNAAVDLDGVEATVAVDGIDAGTTVITSKGSFEIVDGTFSALDGNVVVSGVSFNNPNNLDGSNNVATDMTMWADTNGFNVKVNSIQGNLTLGSIELGGSSIGSVGISDIAMSGATITVSGH